MIRRMLPTIFQFGTFLILVTGSLMLTACMMGPDFHRPDSPKVSQITSDSLPSSTVSASTLAGNVQHFVPAQDIPAQWWKVFHSKPLNELICMALKANPDLKAAEAALRVAQENVQIQEASLFPMVNANFLPTRQLTAHTLASLTSSGAYLFSLNTAAVSVSYVADVFGANRRRIESLRAQAEMACFERDAVYLTLTSNLVLAVVQEASLRAQIKATEESIVIAEKQLKISYKQREYGQVGALYVSAQETALRQLQTTLPPLNNQLAQQRHLIAALTGRFPSELINEKFTLNSLTLPRDLPLSLPSQLVNQRPDIRAAEAMMHAASAQIGVAMANRLPNIRIGADMGSAALTMATVFGSGTKFWDLGANLLQPIFNGGALLHQQRAAVETYKQTAAMYCSTVLSAFQDVANTLKAIEYDAKLLRASAAAAEIAHKNLAIALKQKDLGSVGYLAVLNAELSYQQAKLTLVQSQANRLSDSAALFQAVGGSWVR